MLHSLDISHDKWNTRSTSLDFATERQATQTFKDAEALLELQDEVHQLIEINNKLTEEIHKIATTRSPKTS